MRHPLWVTSYIGQGCPFSALLSECPQTAEQYSMRGIVWLMLSLSPVGRAVTTLSVLKSIPAPLRTA